MDNTLDLAALLTAADVDAPIAPRSAPARTAQLMEVAVDGDGQLYYFADPIGGDDGNMHHYGVASRGHGGIIDVLAADRHGALLSVLLPGMDMEVPVELLGGSALTPANSFAELLADNGFTILH